MKAVRKAVDYGFDMFRPRNDVYSVMGAQSRNDIINIKIEEIEDERMADQLKTIKNEELLRKNIIVAIGKSKLWLKFSLIQLWPFT